MKLRHTLFLAALTVLPASMAHAYESARLTYSRGTGAEACANQDEFEHAVVGQLGENPFDPAATRTFHVEILADGERLVGLVTLLDEQGNSAGARKFEGDRERCHELLSAMGLAVSLAINPELAPAEAEPSAEKAEATPPPANAAPVAAARDAPPSAARAQPERAWVFAAGIDAHVAVGAGPMPSPGFVVLARARTGIASLAVEGRLDLPVDREVDGATVHSTLLGGSVVPCLHYRAFQGCAVGLLANVSAASRGVDFSTPDNGLYAAAGVRLGAGIPIMGTASVEVRGDALMRVKPVDIILDGEVVWTAPVASGTLGAAVVIEIP